MNRKPDAAFDATIGVWLWLLSPAGERLSAAEIANVVQLTRAVYLRIASLDEARQSILKLAARPL